MTSLKYVHQGTGISRGEIRPLAATAVEDGWLSGQDYQYILDCLDNGGGIEFIAAYHTLRVAAWKRTLKGKEG